MCFFAMKAMTLVYSKFVRGTRKSRQVDGGGGGGVLTFFLVINVFNTESRTDLPREAIGPLGPIVSRGGPYQYF